MTRTLVLGAGFGGITVATQLRARLDDTHEIVLVDRAEHFSMGLRKLWQLVGMGTIAEGQRSRALLRERGIRFLQTEIERIDPVARIVTTSDGTFEGEHLVVALGVVPRPDLIPGLAEHGHNIWSAAEVPKLEHALRSVGWHPEHPTRIAILIAGVPYPCPPAPFECAMLLEDWLGRAGVRDHVELSVTTFQPLLLPNAGKPGSDWLASRLQERGIHFQTGRRPKSVEADRILFEDGEFPFDILIGVPPHRVPKVVQESALTGDDPWVQVHPGTLETRFPGVFAIGDVTKIELENGLQLPRAGLMAELQGERVAAAIAAELLGEPAPPPFDGRGFCYLETGIHTAALLDGHFFATPEPEVNLGEESTAHAEAKHQFESERLSRWFGN